MKASAERRANRFIDPAVLAALSSLDLVARSVVEGFIAGMHRSPYHGFSLEFAEYRQYTPGDDIRKVDWKVYGRSDRFYVKEFEGETNTRLYIMLDTSRSMSFGSHQVTKIDYGRFLAAALTYFAIRQKDAVGLLTFDTELHEFAPPRASQRQLLSVLHQLENCPLKGSTNIAGVLEKLKMLISKRSVVVLISDLYEDAEEIASALRFFHHRGNDVVVFHVLDPMEIDLPLGGLSTLEDMETGDQLPFAPEHSREQYLELINQHIETIRKECQVNLLDYELLDTSQPLDRALQRYLSTRARSF